MNQRRGRKFTEFYILSKDKKYVNIKYCYRLKGRKDTGCPKKDL